jgi:hypothetical protein
MRFLGTKAVTDHGGERVPARVFDEHAAAAYLSISVQTLRRMRARRSRGEMGPDGGPLFVHMFSSVRYVVRDLDAYIDSLPRCGGEQ